jgi:ligand-binding SRPBCC domain-containing protein
MRLFSFEAWSFFSNPNNLQLITPPSLGLEATPEIPDKMYAGMIITYRVRPLLGIPMRWITEITHVDAPHMFIDEQRFGPYRFWHHQHRFQEIDGGVEMQDIVSYGLYGGPFAKIIHELAVRKQLEEIFRYRRTYLEARFGILSGSDCR